MSRQPLSERGGKRLQKAFHTYVDKFCAHVSATGATPVLLAPWGYERCEVRAFLVCSSACSAGWLLCSLYVQYL